MGFFEKLKVMVEKQQKLLKEAKEVGRETHHIKVRVAETGVWSAHLSSTFEPKDGEAVYAIHVRSQQEFIDAMERNAGHVRRIPKPKVKDLAVVEVDDEAPDIEHPLVASDREAAL